MPSIFKALGSITVWVLFVFGWLGMLAGVVAAVQITTGLLAAPGIGLPETVAAFGVGVVCFILSVCAMKLRQALK